MICDNCNGYKLLPCRQNYLLVETGKFLCSLFLGFRNGSGPCNGDSGSGFVINRGGRWELRGVVSMSISATHARTCDLKHYVVFTDASKFLTWLLSFVK